MPSNRVVQFGVVQAPDQVRGARTAGRPADTDLPGELGMCATAMKAAISSCRTWMNSIAGALKSPDYAVDAVAGVSVDPPDAPCVQAFNNKIADFHGQLR
jgi:hypothetical protein